MAVMWFYTRNGQASEQPVTTEQLKAMAASGQLMPTDLIWREGLQDWIPASQAKGLFQPSAPAASSAAPAPQAGPDFAEGAPRTNQPSPAYEPVFDPDQRPRRRRPAPDFDEEDADRPQRARRGRPSYSPAGSSSLIGRIAGIAFVVVMVGVGVIGGMNGWFESSSEKARRLTERALRFNDQIIKALDEMDEVHENFHAEINRQVQNNGPIDEAQLEEAYQDVVASVEEAKQEAQSLSVPSKASAKTFFKQCEKWIALREKHLGNLRRIKKIALIPWFAPRQKLEQINGIRGMLAEELRPVNSSLESTQRSFASDYDFKLKPKF